ncbi:acetyl-CoA synthetase-like protein, partial [Saccharata proteae CBS 121410]
LLPAVIDETARASPEKVFAITPRTGSLRDGYTQTTYAQVARAVNKLAWWLDEKLGQWPDGVEPEMLAYIGPRDLRYAIIVVAAMKTNRQVLVPLSQNSPEATINLINLTKPSTLIGTTDMPSVWDGVCAAKPKMRVTMLPQLDELYHDVPVEEYPYTKTWAEGKNDPIHVNHTSGTTGLPKPVPWTNAVGATFDRDRELAAVAPEGKKLAWTLLAQKKIIVTMPPEWIAGLLLTLHFPVYLDTIPILLPTDAPTPLTAEYMDTVHRMLPDADGGVYVPDLLKQLAKHPAYVNNMRHLKMAAYAGAALDKAVGDLLHSFLKVQPLMGTTEVGGFPLLESDPVHWDHLRFDVEHPSGARVVPHEEDGMFELVIQRLRGQDDFQPIFRLEHGKDSDVYHTRDLFEEHPDEKGVWLFVGRTDDFVKLSNLTKFNAGHVEDIINRHPLIREAVMGGDGRKRPFVLVQLVGDVDAGGFRDEREREKMVEAIWPAFEEVNKLVAEDISLRKELVLFTRPERPVVKVGNKGTINRRATLEAYKAEVERIY